jgi:hypothetical protein
LVKQGSCDVYITIPKAWEWLTMNCTINVRRFALHVDYIFKGSRIQEDYIKLSRLGYAWKCRKKLG